MNAPSRHSKPENRALVSAALKLLARRDRNRAEFERALVTQGFSLDDVASVITWCQAEGWLSEHRYAESTVRRLGHKYGASRVRLALRQKGVDPAVAEEASSALRATEHERACALWQRRFGAPPRNAEERAKQMRYLQTRGFSADVCRKVMTAMTES